MPDISKCRIHYKVKFSGRYKGIGDSDIVIIDTQDKENVYDMIHLYLDDPDVRIFVCYSGGIEKELKLL